MAHNIDMTNGRANMAFLGDRKDIWHRLGTPMQAGQTIEQWAVAAGLEWHAVKVPALADISTLRLAEGMSKGGLRKVEDRVFWVRSDNGHPLGYFSDRAVPCQPAEVLDWFARYIGADDRFQLDTAGSLKNGEIIWAQATFNGEMSVVGEKHRARLLMTTAFDGTAATVNKGTMERVVCNNTLDAALADGGKSVIRTRHSAKFNGAVVTAQLAKIAESFDAYKVMGEALAKVEMSKADMSNFFKAMLDIPFDAKADDISGKKMAQFQALGNAYGATVCEGTEANRAWTVLQSVTRYVDHDKHTRGGASADEARVLTANFGSGAALKAKAVQLLYRPAGAALDASLAATTGGLHGAIAATIAGGVAA